ncbi:PAS domain S-box protein [Kaarinaea lacus]
MLKNKLQVAKHGIARKLILYVILFSSLITLIITSAQLYYDYSVEMNNIHESLNQIKSVHLEAISATVWAVDIQNARTQLEGILKVPDMEYLEIRENNKVWMSAGKLNSRNIIEETYPLVHYSRGEPRIIGQLKAVATLDLLYERLINKAVTILLSNGIKTFLVAGFMLLLFHRLVTQHILKIAAFVENHDIDNENLERLEINDPRKNPGVKDELNMLTDHINNMQEKINTSYSKLKISEEKYRRLVEMAQEGIWTIDEKGSTIFVNPAMASMLGYSTEEMVGKHLFDFMDEQGKAIATQNMERRKSGVRENHDFELLRKDGQRIYTTMATAPVYDSDGKYIGALAGVMDITDRVKAEKDLRDHQQLLEGIVQERTKSLEISNKELEAFSYSVAHDLRTPLRSITSFSQILFNEEFDKLSDDGKDNLNRIIRAGKDMSQLIDELLELSRISRVDIQYTTVNISELAENIFNQLLSYSPDRKAKIIITENLEVTADKTLMHIMLQNLIQNAWKFTRKKDLSIIEIGQSDSRNNSCFYIKDNGIGFDMQYKHKLFEAFQRLHGTDYSGNGIGLATVKRILNRHGGTVWAEAKESVGATFYFTVPGNPLSQSGLHRIKAFS